MKNRRNVVLAGGATAFSLLGDQALYAVLPTYYEALGFLPIQVGILLAANRFIRIFTNHWAERLCHRIPPSQLLCWALSIGALLSICYALVLRFPRSSIALGNVLVVYSSDQYDDRCRKHRTGANGSVYGFV